MNWGTRQNKMKSLAQGDNDMAAALPGLELKVEHNTHILNAPTLPQDHDASS